VRVSSRQVGRPAGTSRWRWLLVVPVPAPLAVALVNRAEPPLFGLPFFYWSQFALIVLAMIIVGMVAMLTSTRQ